MTTITKIFAGLSILAISACSQGTTTAAGGGGGGAGGGGGGGGAQLEVDFDAAFNAAINQGPTQTPISGSANYAGELNLSTVDSTGAENGFVVGDLALAVDFDAASNPITGTATNFRGVRDGTDITISGTLDTANSTSINAVSAQTTPLPIGGSLTVTSMNVSLRGDLTDGEFANTYNAEASLTGPFLGTGGAATAGAAGVLTDAVGTNGIVAGGQYYANKQ
jgi:hypothetical protein